MQQYYTPKKPRVNKEKRDKKIIELYNIGRKRIDIHYALEVPYSTVCNVISEYKNRLIMEKLTNSERTLKFKK